MTTIAHRSPHESPGIAPDMISRAWLLQGLGNTPGVLVSTGGVVAFVDDGGTVFEAPKSQIEVSWPRLQMSGGANFVVNGEKHRVAFVLPNGARDTSREVWRSSATALVIAGTVIEIERLAGSIAEGRSAGKRWRVYLS